MFSRLNDAIDFRVAYRVFNELAKFAMTLIPIVRFPANTVLPGNRRKVFSSGYRKVSKRVCGAAFVGSWVVDCSDKTQVDIVLPDQLEEVGEQLKAIFVVQRPVKFLVFVILVDSLDPIGDIFFDDGFSGKPGEVHRKRTSSVRPPVRRIPSRT